MNSTEITPDIFQAVADPNRWTLLNLLLDRPRLVPELGVYFDIFLAAVSQHLTVLLEGGLVSREVRGKYRFYQAEPAALREVHDWTEQYRVFQEDRLGRLGAFLDDQNYPDTETEI